MRKKNAKTQGATSRGSTRSINSKMFKAKCSDGSKWDIVIMKKRTGLFPKGDWTHQSAAAAAYAGVEQEAQNDDDL